MAILPDLAATSKTMWSKVSTRQTKISRKLHIKKKLGSGMALLPFCSMVARVVGIKSTEPGMSTGTTYI